MTERFRVRVGQLLLGACLIPGLCSFSAVAREIAAATSQTSTNASHEVSPGLIDGRVAFLTATMLESQHYTKKPFDEAVSSKFLDLYLDTLDPQHIHFTREDLAEFEPYRTNLNHLIVTDSGIGDARAGCVVFNRYFERLTERTAYVEQLLTNENFTFDKDERIIINRKGMPYPKDLDEAKQLWRERIRFEYLQELLGKEDARHKAALAAKKAPSIAMTQTSVSAPPKNIPVVTVSVAPTPAVAKHAQRPVLQSPKGGEQTLSLLSIKDLAGKCDDNDSCCTPDSSPTRTAAAPMPQAPLTNRVVVPTPKKSDREEIVETLFHRYHRNLRYYADWNNEDVLQIYLSALAHVYDPHSDYLGHAQLDSFAMSMNLGFFGIGAELTLSDDGYCTIRRLLPGGPALKSKKIKENDRIVAVAQGNETPVDVVDMSLPKAVQLIRGPKGTEVRLTIIPAGAESSSRSVVSIVRDEIPLEDSAAKAKIIEMPDEHGNNVRLGVIDLPSFYATFDVSNSKDKPDPKSTTTDVARLLKKLEQENVSGVILDLRRNGGGSLDEAIKLTGLFIKTGPVVQVRREDGKVEELVDNDPSVLYEGPLVVMTSRGSASASEIVAGALQDYNRALVVGDISTHGKGTVQSVNSLAPLMGLRRTITNDPGALKLTIKKFYRPSGASTQLKGVEPDIVLPSVANVLKEVGEKALDNALAYDVIPGAKFDRLNLVQPYLVELNRRSSERITTNKDFVYVREDIQRYEKQQADKTVSLNEATRLKETEELEARAKARDKERIARHNPAEKIYELTLKQAELPGLPPPVGATNSIATAATAVSAGASTNSVAASVKAVLPEEDDEDVKAPAVDAGLEETEHILLDYLSLLPKGNLVTSEH